MQIPFNKPYTTGKEFEYIRDALVREKQLKNWHREWKLNLIKNINPDFCDLAEEWYDRDPDPA